MTKQRSKRYSKEFQESSANLAIGSDQPISRTATELGVDPATLRAWIRKHCTGQGQSSSAQDSEAELKQLRKKLARVTMERDILKKATAYFAGEQQ